MIAPRCSRCDYFPLRRKPRKGESGLYCINCGNWMLAPTPTKKEMLDVIARDKFDERANRVLTNRHPMHYITDEDTWRSHAKMAFDKLSLRAKEMSQNGK